MARSITVVGYLYIVYILGIFDGMVGHVIQVLWPKFSELSFLDVSTVIKYTDHTITFLPYLLPLSA